MALQIKNKYLFIAVLVVLSLCFLVGYVSGHKKGDRASQAQIEALSARIKSDSILIDGTKTYVSQIEQQNSTLKEEIKKGNIEKEVIKKLHLKTVNELTKAQLRINILLDSVAHNGIVITIHDTIVINKDQKAILLPFNFTKKDKWLNLNGTFDINGKMSLEMRLPVSVNVYTGINKKTKKNTCIVTSENPYLGVIDIQSYKFDNPRVKKWSIGAQMGYGIVVSKDIGFYPYVGIGISRSILRF